MSTVGAFNKKNPTIKRILKEASELAQSSSADYHAEPLESNLFEWHFTLRGPPSPSPYAGGLYHGRIVLPTTYPLRPPSFRFLTPTGRFEVNREICLSISGHHEETWQPAWGIRTALVAIRSFMDTDAKGQLGGLVCEEALRRRMASESGAWRCGECGRSNGEIMKARENAAKEMEGQGRKLGDDKVPEELRLAFREELKAGGDVKAKGGPSASSSSASATVAPSTSRPTAAPANGPTPTRTITLQQQPAAASTQQQQTNAGAPAWIDRAILGVVAALAVMILRRFV